jgi:ppGpp synthetase/RelA/SpoT-type nucleotidyltranferase
MLQQETVEALRGQTHIDRISFRAKDTESFAKKVERAAEQNRAYDEPLVEIEDQIAGRVIVFFLQDVAAVEERLRQVYTTVETTRRQPQKDEEFGYESHHLICVIPPQVQPDGWAARKDVPKTFELQIRTLFMHAWAEPQHDLAYKGPADLPREIRRELAWIAASAWGADQAYERVWRWQERGKSGDVPNEES